ncbi:hypothetical protein FA13DRAFT_1711087 [Coprinellus micaceus]|uniref:Response regulatory domain-containing protein n=1 Tax=Coprinellus micaceus TaxID=71717 RepID=A0A4Y7T642_COPMI|nr:hypothetical protein FA13DRAFT_1711087 [Coprinellus micaceus]
MESERHRSCLRLRMTSNGECVLESDVVSLEAAPSSSGFSVSIAQTGKSWGPNSTPSSTTSIAATAAFRDSLENGTDVLSDSMTFGDTSTLLLGRTKRSASVHGGFEEELPSQHEARPELLSTRSEVPPPFAAKDGIASPPRFSRATTMPLPSQLNQLQHPYRTPRSTSFTGSLDSTREASEEPSSSGEYGTPMSDPSTSQSSNGYDSPHVRELSYELADSIQMVVQTLLQISPAQVLDPAKEQFTACSLSVPTTSMSAMFTVMKNINYLSANMSSYFAEEVLARRASLGTPDATLPPLPPTPSVERIEFDIGETLQAVGDSLSGCAAQAGVDLVLYHEDSVSLKHVSVYGDEASIRYAITQVIQQVLNTAERGDSVELGLILSSLSNTDPESSAPPSNEDDPVSSQVSGAPVQCKIQIAHKFTPPERGESSPYGPEPEQIRPPPNLSTISIRRILRQTDATLRSDLPPPVNFPTGRSIELDFPLRRASATFFAAPGAAIGAESLSSLRPDSELHARDATLPHLIQFAETLKGKKATLYASSNGCFAQHLTSYLTTLGMLVSHVTPDGALDGVTDLPSASLDQITPSGGNSALSALSALSSPKADGKTNGVLPEGDGRKPVSFIFIDDDIEILKERLHALRTEQVTPAPFLQSMKRPPLASLHRPRSTNQIPFASPQATVLRPPCPTVILHFTSLSNYKHLKETVQSIIATYTGSPSPIPEVMIIPKPAGPRRFLAALFTAVKKPPVDPQFVPIATSPMSPSVPTPGGPFFFGPPPPPPTSVSSEPPPNPSALSQPASPSHSIRPTGTRSNSDRSVKSNRDTLESPAIPPTPPIFMPNDYFPTSLGTNPSSGFVIQSPDGQPTGILFRPNPKGKGTGKTSPRNTSPPTMTRSDQVKMPSLSRRGTSVVSPSGVLAFGALHAAGSVAGPSSASTSSAEAGPSSSSGTPLSISPSNSGFSSSSTLQASGRTPTPASEKAPSSSSAMSPTKAALALASASASASGMLRKGTTRQSSAGPKTMSPPGSPQSDTASGKRPSPRRGSHVDKEGSTNPAANHGPSTGSSSSIPFKKGKAPESNIIPPISVLIVDDNPINQTILSTFMRKKKIKYDIANNGAEAVAKFKTGGFHLILMDIQMPIMDGIEATKEIRRLEKTSASSGFPSLTPTTEGQRTPSDISVASESRSVASPYRSSVIIVALTASSLPSDRVAALAAGCNDFLTKPVSLLWLNNKIIEWGSIKALQMWADLRPDAVRSMNSGQAVQARAVADNLHMPSSLGRRRTPSPRRSSSLHEEQQAAIALASPSGNVPQTVQKAIATAEAQAEAAKASAAAAAAVLEHNAAAAAIAESLGGSTSLPATPIPSRLPGVLGSSSRRLSHPPSRRTSSSPEALPPRVRRVSADVDSDRDGGRSVSPVSSVYATPPTHPENTPSEPIPQDLVIHEREDISTPTSDLPPDNPTRTRNPQ